MDDGEPKTPPAKKLSKTVKKCNIPKPVQSSNNNSVSVGNGSHTDSMKTYDIKTNNQNQKMIYKDVLPKFLYRPMIPLPDLFEHT